MFPAYDLNRAYQDTDVFVSLAKLKNHATCGVTLSLKNCFGTTPASIYGDNAGAGEPNEKPTSGREAVLHNGRRQPSKSAPPELHPDSSREPGYRVPHIVADLVAARPIHLAIIDGVESIAGGEGPWIKGIRIVKPGVLIGGSQSGVDRRGGHRRHGLQPARTPRRPRPSAPATTRCCWRKPTA
jgi:hypothetical protein